MIHRWNLLYILAPLVALTMPAVHGARIVEAGEQQCHHVHQQIVLFDHGLGPHEVHQLVRGHHPFTPLDDREQDRECARADPGRSAIDQHLPQRRDDFAGATTVDGTGSGRSPVVHGCRIRSAGATPEVPGYRINHEVIAPQ